MRGGRIPGQAKIPVMRPLLPKARQQATALLDNMLSARSYSPAAQAMQQWVRARKSGCQANGSLKEPYTLRGTFIKEPCTLKGTLNPMKLN